MHAVRTPEPTMAYSTKLSIYLAMVITLTFPQAQLQLAALCTPAGLRLGHPVPPLAAQTPVMQQMLSFSAEYLG